MTKEEAWEHLQRRMAIEVLTSAKDIFDFTWAARGKRDAAVIEAVKKRVEYQRMVCGNCADLVAEAIERED